MVEKIENIVCDYYKIKSFLLYTKTRKREIVFPRQILMYLYMSHLKMTSIKAADVYSRDHATALHAKKTILNLCETDNKIRSQVKQIKSLLPIKEPKNPLIIENINLLKLTINYTNSLIC